MPARGYHSASIASLLLIAVALSANASDSVHTISHVKDVRKLSSGDAAHAWPVTIFGVVTALSGWKNSFFLEESGTGISVDRTDNVEVHPGDRVEIAGATAAGSFAPVIAARRVTLLGHGNAPIPRKALYHDLANGEQDSQWVEIEGTVRSASVANSWGRPVLFLRIDTGSGLIVARVHDFENADYSHLIDARVQVRGVCGTNFNERRQFVGLRLFVPDLRDVVVKEASPVDPFSIPESGLDTLFRFTSSQSAVHRVKISGIVTYAKPGAVLYLEDNGQGIAVATTERTLFPPGTQVEAAGFVASGAYSAVLEDAIIRKTGVGSPPKPIHIGASQAIQSNNDFPFAPYDGVLIDTSGEVISQIDHPGESIWYLRDGTTVFEAQLQAHSGLGAVPAIGEGTRVRLTGICSVVTDQNRDPKYFRLLLRSAADISVTSRPWISRGNALWLIGLLVLACFGTLLWAAQLRRALIPRSASAVERISSLYSWLSSASDWIAKSVTAVALVVLLGGWALHFQLLIRMRANTAFGLALIGLATWIHTDGLKKSAKCIVCIVCLSTSALLGLLTLSEYLTGRDVGIDQLLFNNVSTAGFAGRMPVLTASSLMLFALGGLLLWYTRRLFIAQSLILMAATVCLMKALGIIYGVPDVFGLQQQTSMPITSALSGLAIGVAVLFSHPERGIMQAVSSDAPGGILARRLLPAAIVIPTVLGWVLGEGQLRGLYGTNTGLVLFTSAIVVVFSILIWMNAGLLNRLYVDRLRAETHSRIAEAANRAKGDFLAVVSHEIRTPMNSILGMADILRQSQLDTDQRRYVDFLRRAAANLMTLINDILDLSKIEAGKVELEHAPFDVREVVEQALEVIEASARAKGLALRIDFEKELETAVMGDPVRLRQVFLNLLGNAVKFTDNGWITVTARRSSEQAGAIQFAVADSGIGIPEDKAAAIFEDFTQADSSTTRKYGGTGLGLGITRRLVELMGGRISVTSFPGKGSTFQFTAPFQPAQSTAAQNTEESERTRSPKIGQPLRLLIADDSADNRLLVDIYLKETPHILSFASDGRGAVNKFEKARFDLIFMDMRMPVMDGLAATRAIRRLEQERGLPRTPIIALTANARLEDIEASREAGCDAHLSKPLSKSNLLETLGQYAVTLEAATEALKQIRIHIPAGFEEVAPRYLADRKSEVAVSARALATSNFEQIRTLAHNWKGTGSSYGFAELTALGAAIEDSARRQDSVALKTQLAELEKYLVKVELSES